MSFLRKMKPGDHISIRTRFIILYAVLITISSALLFGAMVRATQNFINELGETTIGERTYTQFNTDTMDAMVEIFYLARQEPDMLGDQETMVEIESSIAYYQMLMYVIQDGQMIYKSMNSPSGLDAEEFLNGLDYSSPEVEQAGPYGFDGITLKDGDNPYFVMRHDLNVVEAEETYVYIVYDVSIFESMGHRVYGHVFLGVGIFNLIVIIIMITIINQNIIKPIRKLEQATEDVRQGNLDFSIATQSNNELGRLMNGFDRMREALKESLEQQMAYEENRKELLSSISHDLKTPITSIKGYVEGIRDGIANDDEKRSRYLEVIYNKSNDMDRLIDDLFLFSKLDLNRLPFDFSIVKAKGFFGDSKDELHTDLEKMGFVMTYDEALRENTRILVDQQKIKRVINNVIGNAVKYSTDKARIDIRVYEDDSKVVMAIKDYGKGITEEALDRIFERFYRADSSRNADVAGTGLGLAIAKQIMEQHQGTIHAESVIGQGTTVYLSLKKMED